MKKDLRALGWERGGVGRKEVCLCRVEEARCEEGRSTDEGGRLSTAWPKGDPTCARPSRATPAPRQG